MPLLEVTPRLQRDDHDCGEAVFRMACETLGLVRRVQSADVFHGTHPLEIEPMFRRAGLRVQAGEMDLGDLRYHAGRGRPVAVLVRNAFGGHWVLSRGVSRGFVHYCDPTNGLCRMEAELFQDLWYDKDRHGTIFRGHGVAVWV